MIQHPAIGPLPADTAPLAAYLAAQPRRVRFFNSRLEVAWSNRPEGSEEAGPCFGGNGTIPPEGPEWEHWPVVRVLGGLPSATRLYPAGEENGRGSGSAWKVTAWPLRTDEQFLVVEETEQVAAPEETEVEIGKLDQDIEDLLHHVFQYLHKGTQNGTLRLPNPHLVKCIEERVCTNPACPAYNNPEAERCWEVTAFKASESGEKVDVLSKFHACSECRVFDLASPTPVARISENFNRLISVLQLKYQETLDVQHRMQQADKLAVMGQLLAGIAHEIKNPLGIIMGRLDVIGLEMEAVEDGAFSEDMAAIYHQANRVRQIIDHLLGMARPQPPSFRPIHVNSVVVDSLEMVRKTLQKAGVRVMADLQPDLPAIHADQVQVQQVLLNLILNARDAMPSGGELRIASRVVNGTEPGVEVTVEDEGEGIAPDLLRRLFSTFQTTKLNKGGTGVGLAVCRKIMELHNGTISAESELEVGTTMRLWFPLRGNRP